MGQGTHQEYFLGVGEPEALQQKVTFWPDSRTRDSGCFTRYGFSGGRGGKGQCPALCQLPLKTLPKGRAPSVPFQGHPNSPVLPLMALLHPSLPHICWRGCSSSCFPLQLHVLPCIFSNDVVTQYFYTPPPPHDLLLHLKDSLLPSISSPAPQPPHPCHQALTQLSKDNGDQSRDGAISLGLAHAC